ncbi:MAG: cell division protein FtsH, partial [Alphaproteobacteria bacterium]
KVTIIPRGRALGLTMGLPEKDRLSISRREIEARLAMMFGGRVAEEIVFGDDNVTTGAGNDIKQATSLARRMVTEWGMSDILGPLSYGENEEEIFLGHSVAQRKNMSDATAKTIDEEVRRIIESAETLARSVIEEHREGLENLAKGLLEYESHTGDEARKLLNGETITRAPTEEPPGPKGPRASVPASGKPSGPGGLEPKPQPGT